MIDSRHNDAAPDLTPEPRQTPRYERSIEMESTALPDPAWQVSLIRSIAAYATGREAAALAEITAVVNGAGIHDLLEMRGV